MFELNGIKYNFNRITVEDALEVQGIMVQSSRDDLSVEDSQKLDRKLREIAVKYLVVYLKHGNKEESMTDMDMDYYAEVFDNPFYTNEIVISFGEVVKGFLQILPSYKKSLEKQSNKKSQNTSK